MDIKIISEVIKNSYGIVNRVVKNLKSTDGNVYDVFTQDGRYIVKIYNDLKHVNKMIRIVDMLNVNNIKVPNIITNLFNLKYISINNSYLVVYEFLNGKSIINDDITGLISREIIIKIAKEVRKMHDLMIYNDIELKKLEIKFIKKCALNWIDYTLKNNDLRISINESFETKKKLIKEYL